MRVRGREPPRLINAPNCSESQSPDKGPWKAGVAPTASLNGIRRSEKAKVLEKA